VPSQLWRGSSAALSARRRLGLSRQYSASAQGAPQRAPACLSDLREARRCGHARRRPVPGRAAGRTRTAAIVSEPMMAMGRSRPGSRACAHRAAAALRADRRHPAPLAPERDAKRTVPAMLRETRGGRRAAQQQAAAAGLWAGRRAGGARPGGAPPLPCCMRRRTLRQQQAQSPPLLPPHMHCGTRERGGWGRAAGRAAVCEEDDARRAEHALVAKVPEVVPVVLVGVRE